MKIEFNSSGDDDRLTSINVARALIEHETPYTNFFKEESTRSTFSIADLEEIANHLLNYCKYEKIRNGEE